jgi:hypothetical protein
LPDGTIFIDCWGPGLLIDQEDFGGVEILPPDVHTASVGPWLGANGDDQYRVFCLRDNCLTNYIDQPPQERIANAEKMPKLAPKADVIPLDPAKRTKERCANFLEAVASGG